MWFPQAQIRIRRLDMVAYIVGMVVGSVTLIFPLIYMMSFESSRAVALAQNPELDLAPYCPEGMLIGTCVIGAVVLLLSTALMAFTGLRRIGRYKDEPEEAAEPEDLP
jgi:hypothetical protein